MTNATLLLIGTVGLAVGFLALRRMFPNKLKGLSYGSFELYLALALLFSALVFALFS